MKSKKMIPNKRMPVSDSDTRKQKVKVSGIARNSFFLAMLILTFYVNAYPVFATDATSAITGKFDTFYDLVCAVIQAIGGVILVWGAFEFGNSMQQQEGGATTRALQRVGGGLVMLVAPAIATAMIG